LILLAATRPPLRRWNREQWTAVVLLGASMAGMNGLFYEAIARIPLGAAITIEFVGPLGLAAALSRRPRDLVWVVMALTGVALLGLRSPVGSSLTVAGLAFAIGAGAFWAAYIATGARLAATGSGAGGLAASTATAALIVVPAGQASVVGRLFQPHILLLGALVALLASAIPYSCEIAALSRLPKRTFSVLLALEPAAGALAGAALLGQHIGRSSALAVVLVIAAAAGSTLTTT
jgi:inner membrane transporter RhtA